MSCEYAFSTDDKCLRTENLKQLRNSKILLILMGLIVIVLTILGIIRFFPIQASWNDLMEFSDLINLILSAVIFIFTVFLYWKIADYLYYKHCLLKACGISPKSSLWVIEFMEGKVCEIRVLCAKENYFTFDKTLFKCRVVEREKKFTVILPGRDIYFSENDAVSVMNYIEKANNEVLESYYPKWKQDADFVSFFQKRQANRIKNNYTWSKYGHYCLKPIFKNCLGLITETSYVYLAKPPRSLIVLTPIIINEIEYEPFFSAFNSLTNTENVEKLFEDFIEEEKERKRSAEKTQNLINQINELSTGKGVLYGKELQ